MNEVGSKLSWQGLSAMLNSLLVSMLLGGIKVYRYCLSPWIGGQCRFYPTCSHYAEQALHTHGAATGSWLAARRLCKCHPFTAGGVDEVPLPNKKSS